jgi:hypothetical protein
MGVSNDVEDPQPSARALSSRSDSIGQRHDRADEQQHKVGLHFLSPRSAIAPNFRFRLPETVSPKSIRRAGNGFAPIAIVGAGLLQPMSTFADFLRIGAKALQARQYRHSIRVRMR